MTDPFPNLVLPMPSLEVHNIPPEITQSKTSTPPDLQDFTADNILENSPDEVHVISPPIPYHSPTPDAVLVRKSSRFTKPPSYLRDFHCNLISHKDLPPCATSYSLSKYLSYDSLSSSHKAFVMSVSL